MPHAERDHPRETTSREQFVLLWGLTICFSRNTMEFVRSFLYNMCLAHLLTARNDEFAHDTDRDRQRYRLGEGQRKDNLEGQRGKQQLPPAWLKCYHPKKTDSAEDEFKSGRAGHLRPTQAIPWRLGRLHKL